MSTPKDHSAATPLREAYDNLSRTEEVWRLVTTRAYRRGFRATLYV
jgi:hypothetical protein